MITESVDTTRAVDFVDADELDTSITYCSLDILKVDGLWHALPETSYPEALEMEMEQVAESDKMSRLREAIRAQCDARWLLAQSHKAYLILKEKSI